MTTRHISRDMAILNFRNKLLHISLLCFLHSGSLPLYLIFFLYSPEYRIHEYHDQQHYSHRCPEPHIESKPFTSSKNHHPEFSPVHLFSPPRAVRHNNEHMLSSNLLPVSYTAEYMESGMQSKPPVKPQDQVQPQVA